MKQMVATEEIEKLKELQPVSDEHIEQVAQGVIDDTIDNVESGTIVDALGLDSDGKLVKGSGGGGGKTLYMHNISFTYGASPTYSQYIKLTIINDSATTFTTIAKVRDYIASNGLDSYNKSIMATGFITIDSVRYQILSIGALANNNLLRMNGYKIDGTGTTTESIGVNISNSPFNQLNHEDIVIQL